MRIRYVSLSTEVEMKRVCIVGASGKLGKYMVQHALDRGYEVVGVCRECSVGKLDGIKGRITVIPGNTNDREVIRKAVAGCDGALTVLVPWEFTSTHWEQPRRYSTTRLRIHASYSIAAGILHGTVRMCTRVPSRCL